ncbi:MAG: hypothetical protein IPL42_01320 [Saprospiraceae bacterium]|nr:hypothetical protein [Saprospiraceae bacterium]
MELNISKITFFISAEFDDLGDLRIGVKDDGKSTLPATLSILPFDVENDWLIRKKYSYLNITNTLQVKFLIDQIRDEVFDAKKKGSLLNTII